MQRENKYPTVYEIEEVLSNITNRKFINAFAQKRGIFLTHASREDLGRELSNYFYSEEDLQEIRKEAYQLKSIHALSGFTLSRKSKFDLKSNYEALIERGDYKKGLMPSNLRKIPNENSYRGSIEYTKKKVGRIEFLQHEESSFEFILKELDEKTWQVEVDCSRSTDLSIMRDIFKQLPNDVTHEEILQDELSTKNAILFLDQLAKDGLDSTWRFEDVKHLAFKREKIRDKKDDNIVDDDFEDEDSLEIDADTDDLIGISQAILQGKNLRENSFVKECEKSGYLFTAMTYEYENLSNGKFIQIKAEFKGRPKVFEVSIVSTEELDGSIKPKRKPISMSEKECMEIKSLFWNNAKIIYDGLVLI